MIGKKQKRSGLGVVLGLIGMVKPLIIFMLLAIFMGCIGNLMATFITVLGGVGIGIVLGEFSEMSKGAVFVLLAVFAVLRGVLRYGEQACNHYIAFRLLASIRHQVFASLRRLAPAKLEGREKGNLISIITSDIELLEVFYAHTISPVAIAVITSLFMSLFIGSFSWQAGLAAAAFYFVVGVILPIINGRMGQTYGQTYRKDYGVLNTVLLDNLYGLEEIIQYQQEQQRQKKMRSVTKTMEETSKTLKKQEAATKLITDGVILFAGIIMLILCGNLAAKGEMTFAQCVICTIGMMSSFGPTAALSALSNNLNQTFASGNRVLDLLEEAPVVKDVVNGQEMRDGHIHVNHVSFSYENEEGEKEVVLKDFNARFSPNKIHGILGKSGCGKSTLLKLMMRFYETEEGSISYGHTNVNNINTQSLRGKISYVTQETFLFEDTIENNIKVANENATREDVINAAKKASIHQFINALPMGYDTCLKELGDSVSGGERQRIGLARAFLHGAEILFLDEPTSNIDSLNESIILKSLQREKENKNIVLVSHRQSTMAIADQVIPMAGNN